MAKIQNYIETERQPLGFVGSLRGSEMLPRRTGDGRTGVVRDRLPDG
jgi:hypothetical protein